MHEDFKPVTKVFLTTPGGHGKPFLGPGMIRLLDMIKKTGNVRKACEEMQMSYSKGWKLLKALEECLARPVVIRRQGGKGGGDTILTADGEAFLKNHHAFETACSAVVEKLFKKYYR